MDLAKAVGVDMQRQRERKMYGCTEAELRDSIESSITFKFSGPAMIAAGLMSDCQEMLAFSGQNDDSREHVRQMLNQAKFVLFTYVMDKGE